jgi:hypothetical protein
MGLIFIDTLISSQSWMLEYGPILKGKRRVKGKAKKLSWPLLHSG